MRPVLFHVVDRMPSFVAEAVDELTRHGVAATFGWSVDKFGVF